MEQRAWPIILAFLSRLKVNAISLEKQLKQNRNCWLVLSQEGGGGWEIYRIIWIPSRQLFIEKAKCHCNVMLLTIWGNCMDFKLFLWWSKTKSRLCSVVAFRYHQPTSNFRPDFFCCSVLKSGPALNQIHKCTQHNFEGNKTALTESTLTVFSARNGFAAWRLTSALSWEPGECCRRMTGEQEWKNKHQMPRRWTD